MFGASFFPRIKAVLLVGFLIGFWGAKNLWAQTGIPVAQMSSCDNLFTQFLNQYSLPGATVAIAKDGKLVYMRAFGQADIGGQEPTQPYHMFRIASVSKPITSIAIMKLVEGGQLNLSDKVFGSGGILENHPYLGQVSYSDTRINDITVQHLLEHSAGWDRDVDCVPSPNPPYPWQINHCDPIGFPLYVTQTLGEPNPVTRGMLIRFVMEKGLNFAPGTDYAYSNMGFLTLGLVIEQVTGQSYEDYVKQAVLEPLGIYDMHIGKNLLEDKREREGEYIGNGYTAPSIYGTGQNVPWEYGGWNLEAMDAHGGWIASARDLVRLLVAVDGFATKPDILSANSIQTMTTPSANNAFYALGWSVNSFNNWWHNGSLDGTASIWVRSNNGYTWAVILNKRVLNNSNAFWSDFDNLPWNCIAQASGFPSHDLLASPLVNSKDLTINPAANNTLQLSWTGGDGEQRLVVVSEGEPVSAFPLDGQNYSFDQAFGSGDDLGNANYVVYNGNGSQAQVTGLTPGQMYHFRIFEYNQNATTGNHALYLLGGSLQDSATTTGAASIQDLLAAGIRFFPNPAQNWLNVELDQPGIADEVRLINLQGQEVARQDLTASKAQIDLSGINRQMYLVSFWKDGVFLGSDRLVLH